MNPNREELGDWLEVSCEVYIVMCVDQTGWGNMEIGGAFWQVGEWRRDSSGYKWGNNSGPRYAHSLSSRIRWGGGGLEEDMTSLVTAQVLQRHRLLGEGVCMIVWEEG